jgi:hypothetical protein
VVRNAMIVVVNITTRKNVIQVVRSVVTAAVKGKVVITDIKTKTSQIREVFVFKLLHIITNLSISEIMWFLYSKRLLRVVDEKMINFF